LSVDHDEYFLKNLDKYKIKNFPELFSLDGQQELTTESKSQQTVEENFYGINRQ
jgi:hypothetical protein